MLPDFFEAGLGVLLTGGSRYKREQARWAEPNQINCDWLVRRDGACTPGSSSLSRYDRKKGEKDANAYGSSFGDGHVSRDGRRHRKCASTVVGGTGQLLE